MNFYWRHLKQIFSQNLEGFRLSNHGTLPYLEVFIFYGIPIFASVFFVAIGEPPQELFDNLLVTLSIFMGFLISMLVPFLNFVETAIKYETDQEQGEKRILNILQYRIMYSQVVFCILMSVIGIIGLIAINSMDSIKSKWVIEIFDTSFSLGSLAYSMALFVVFSSSFLNILNIFRILISANVVIYPRLKEMTKTSKNSLKD